jgi:hypothetical protein
MFPLRFLRLLVLAYLSIVALFPLYHGVEDGEEFHLFGIFEPIQNYAFHREPAIQDGRDTGHPHSLLFYYPPSQTRYRYQLGELAKIISSATLISLFDQAEYLSTDIMPAPLHASYFYGHKSSGLSPPVI